MAEKFTARAICLSIQQIFYEKIYYYFVCRSREKKRYTRSSLLFFPYLRFYFPSILFSFQYFYPYPSPLMRFSFLAMHAVCMIRDSCVVCIRHFRLFNNSCSFHIIAIIIIYVLWITTCYTLLSIDAMRYKYAMV